MFELLVRSLLASLTKTKLLQNRDDLSRLQYRNVAHLRDPHCNRLDAYELCLELRLTLLEEHLDDLLEVALEFIERLGLGVGTGESGNVADQQASLRILFHDCS